MLEGTAASKVAKLEGEMTRLRDAMDGDAAALQDTIDTLHDKLEAAQAQLEEREGKLLEALTSIEDLTAQLQASKQVRPTPSQPRTNPAIPWTASLPASADLLPAPHQSF